MPDDFDQPQAPMSDLIGFIDNEIKGWQSHPNQELGQYHIDILNQAKKSIAARMNQIDTGQRVSAAARQTGPQSPPALAEGLRYILRGPGR